MTVDAEVLQGGGSPEADPSAQEAVIQGLQARIKGLAGIFDPESKKFGLQDSRLGELAELVPAAAKAFPDRVAAQAAALAEEQGSAEVLKGELKAAGFYDVWGAVRHAAPGIETTVANKIAFDRNKDRPEAAREGSRARMNQLAHGGVARAVEWLGAGFERATLSAIGPTTQPVYRDSTKIAFWPGSRRQEPVLPPHVREGDERLALDDHGGLRQQEGTDRLAHSVFTETLTAMVEALEGLDHTPLLVADHKIVVPMRKARPRMRPRTQPTIWHVFDERVDDLEQFIKEGILPEQDQATLTGEILGCLEAYGMLPRSGTERQTIIRQAVGYLKMNLDETVLTEWLRRELESMTKDGVRTPLAKESNLYNGLTFIRGVMADVALANKAPMSDDQVAVILWGIADLKGANGEYAEAEVEAAKQQIPGIVDPGSAEAQSAEDEDEGQDPVQAARERKFGKQGYERTDPTKPRVAVLAAASVALVAALVVRGHEEVGAAAGVTADVVGVGVDGGQALVSGAGDFIDWLRHGRDEDEGETSPTSVPPITVAP